MAKLITPESLAGESEDSQQLALMCWCALNISIYPELKWLHHSPNGGARSKSEGARFKAMGVKSGFPDLVLLVKRGNWSGLLVELKIPKHKTSKNGGASDSQVMWGEYLLNAGYGFKLCHGWEDARDTLVSYLQWR